MAAWRYEFYFLVVKTIYLTHLLCSFVKYCLYHSKIKLISSRRGVISSTYKICGIWWTSFLFEWHKWEKTQPRSPIVNCTVLGFFTFLELHVSLPTRCLACLFNISLYFCSFTSFLFFSLTLFRALVHLYRVVSFLLTFFCTLVPFTVIVLSYVSSLVLC